MASRTISESVLALETGPGNPCARDHGLECKSVDMYFGAGFTSAPQDLTDEWMEWNLTTPKAMQEGALALEMLELKP